MWCGRGEVDGFPGAAVQWVVGVVFRAVAHLGEAVEGVIDVVVDGGGGADLFDVLEAVADAVIGVVVLGEDGGGGAAVDELPEGVVGVVLIAGAGAVGSRVHLGLPSIAPFIMSRFKM